MKQIKDLPASVTVILDEDSGIEYPANGEFETSFEVELICFSKKSYLKTWPLRQRIMKATTQLMSDYKDLIDSADDASPNAKGEEDESVDVDTMKQMLLMCGFDAVAAMEEFKHLAVAGGLIKVTENVVMCKNRWTKVDDVTKELLLFTYLATFISPCVV